MSAFDEISPGSIALLSDGTGLARYPDGSGWYFSLTSRDRVEAADLRAIECPTDAPSGWSWDKLDSFLRSASVARVAATGLAVEDFRSAERLAAACAAPAAATGPKVGDEVPSADLPLRCVAKSLDEGWGEVAHVHADMSYTWITCANGSAAAGRGVSARVADAPPQRWRILALGVPDAALPHEARALAGLPEYPPAAGEVLPPFALPAGAVAERGDALLHVLSDRSGRRVEMGTGQPVDKAALRADDGQFTILALGVPDAATAAVARARAGRSRVGDQIPSEEQRPGSLTEEVGAAAESTTRYCARRADGRGWRFGITGGYRDDLHAGLNRWWSWGERNPGHVRVVAVDVPDDAWLDRERVSALLGAATAASGPKVGDEVDEVAQPRRSIARRLGAYVSKEQAYRARRADGLVWNFGAEPSGYDRKKLTDGRAEWWDVERAGAGERVRLLALDVPDEAWSDSARIDALIRGAGPAKPERAPALPGWATASDRGALFACGEWIGLRWPAPSGGRRWARIGAAEASQTEPDEALASALAGGAAEVLLEGVDADEARTIALLGPSTRRAAESVAGMLQHLRGALGARALARQPDGWAILRGNIHAGIAGGGRFDWIKGGVDKRSDTSALPHDAGTWAMEERWRHVLADGLTEAQARAFARAACALAIGDRPRYALDAARWWHAATPEQRRSPPSDHAWAGSGARPAWASDAAGALVLHGNLPVLWWPAQPGQTGRWSSLHCVSGAEGVARAEPIELDPWSTGEAGALAGAILLLGNLTDEELRQVARLRPDTATAARSVAAMLEGARGRADRAPAGCALLRGRDGNGIRWADGAYDFNRGERGQFSAEQWAKSHSSIDVLADGLTEAQARALWERAEDDEGFALAAARYWHRFGGEAMAKAPPTDHEWAAAKAPSDLGTIEVFGGHDAPPGTLVVRADSGRGVWLRCAAGWAYLSSDGYGTARGFAGDELMAPPRRSAAVLARDLSVEAQALLLLRAAEARAKGEPPTTREAVAPMLEAALREEAEARQDPTKLARLRGRLLRDLAAEPWASGWRERRVLSEREAEDRAARFARAALAAFLPFGLVARFVKRDASTVLRFAEWRGAPLPAAATAGNFADAYPRILGAALEAALAEPAAPVGDRGRALLRMRGQPTDAARLVLPGHRTLLALAPSEGQREVDEVDNDLWRECDRLLTAAGLPRAAAGADPSVVPAGGSAVRLGQGGAVAPDPSRSTLLFVVGAPGSEEDLGRAVRALLPLLEREARRRKARAGLVALGPETRARLL